MPVSGIHRFSKEVISVNCNIFCIPLIQSIYDDVGDYMPSLSKNDSKSKKDENETAKKRSYFGEKEVKEAIYLF